MQEDDMRDREGHRYKITFNLSHELRVYHKWAKSEAQALHLARRTLMNESEVSWMRILELDYEVKMMD
jgi:hypothetical protein